MIIVLLGPPGSGKGTQAKLLSMELKIPHISTGDIFRSHIKNETPIGKKIKSLLDQGHFAPDEIVNEVIDDRLKQADCKNGFILDGYPRNIAQVIRFSKSKYQPDHVIYLKTSAEEIIERLTNRAKIEKPSVLR